MTQELLSKLSLKGIGAQPKRGEVKEGDAPKAIALLFGRAHGYSIGQSTFGEFTKFKGSFEGKNIADGKTYKSGNVLLPKIVEDLLREAIDAADGVAIDFALEVGIKPAANAFGYEYTVRPLVEVKESDELAALRNVVYGNALPAPEAAADAAAAPAADAKGAKGKGK